MLSKNKIKFFNSLKVRKYREKYRLFLAEGDKIVNDLLKSNLNVEYIILENNTLFENENISKNKIIRCSDIDIKKISNLHTPVGIIGAFNIPSSQLIIDELKDKITLFCDGIQDPGNFGTIIRTADWFGIEHVICSKGTADIYNPKVVQASMGAIAGVKVFYADTEEFFNQIKGKLTIYGTFLEGESIFDLNPEKSSVIVIGNEGKGISEKVCTYIEKKIVIPSISGGRNISESLNVSVATGIICSEFCRRMLL